jgi:endo-1,4-beta-xylanase
VPDGAFEVRASGTGFADAATDVTLTRAAPDATAEIELPVTLGSVAALRGLPVGAAVAVNPLRGEDIYRETMALEFSSVTPENAMKFGPLRPGRNQFDFDNADHIMGFAEANDLRVHGHVLLWHHQLADWLTNGGYTPEELLEILKEHITTVVERYAGRIASWDVANEVVTWQGLRTDGFWLQEVGPEVIDSAFHWAHAADPDAKLYINDFGIEVPGPKVDVLYDLVTGLLERGVPVHGVGIQGHIVAETPPTGEQLATVLGRFSALGLETRITELDIRLETPASQEDLDRQAAIYGDLVAAAVADPGFAGLTFWGFTDRYSWIPNHAPGYGAALLFDSAYQRKPAYYAARDALEP